MEGIQLEFFRKRGSTFMMASAIARCLEIFLSKPLPNPFSMAFRSNLSPEEAADRWSPIVESASSFTAPLVEGLSDGFKTHEIVNKAIHTFRSFISATKEANADIYARFAKQVI